MKKVLFKAEVYPNVTNSNFRKLHTNTIDEDEKLNGTLFLSGQNRNVWFLTGVGIYEVLGRKSIIFS